ncbi:hypothetical protein ACSLVN_27795, partial [Klebsiella pneumoniae]|uniref:hypothetical protein n=1 Tax=Klebsiella pneumoniae TaxID=573 RepID=UPI003EE022DC
ATFTNADSGIAIAQHHEYSPWRNHFEIANSQFSGLSAQGIALGFASVIDLLSGNSFSGITSMGGPRAAALLVSGASSPPPFFSV